MTQDDGLPVGWRRLPVSALADEVSYGSSAKTLEGPYGVPVLRMGNILHGELRWDDLRFLPASHPEFPQLLLAPGDVLFNRTNSPELVGKTAMFAGERTPASFASYLLRIRFRSYEPRLFVYFMRSSPARDWIRASVNQQVGQANINGSKLKALEVPVPPAAEQRRIVSKLDDLLAHTRRAKKALDAVPPLLETLRRSILAAAFRGDLTVEWREKHPDVEPAERLLARIRVERRKKWEEAELARLRAKGKAPGDDRWKEKYREPEPVDESGLPELPDGWAWAGLSEVAEVQLGQQRAPIHSSAEVTFPYVRAANITWDGLDLSDVNRMGFPDLDRYRLAPGDVLLSEASGSPSEVGKPAIWRGEIEECGYQKTLLRVRPMTSLASSEWLRSSFLHDALSGKFAAMAPGVGIVHLTADRMMAWPVPIAPLEEQRLVVARSDRALLTVGALETRQRALQQRIQLADRAMLAQAFRGELVAQDPNDEPADVMLARVAREARWEGSTTTAKHETKRNRASTAAGRR